MADFKDFFQDLVKKCDIESYNLDIIRSTYGDYFQ